MPLSLVIRSSSEQDAEAVGTLAAEFQEYMRSLKDPTEFNWGASDYLRDGFGKFPALQTPRHFLSFEVCDHYR